MFGLLAFVGHVWLVGLVGHAGLVGLVAHVGLLGIVGFIGHEGLVGHVGLVGCVGLVVFLFIFNEPSANDFSTYLHEGTYVMYLKGLSAIL